MHTRALLPVRAIAAGLALALPLSAWAFNSGSTGADGVLAPTVNTEITLPPSGVLNYTGINIPTGVTVTFKKNATNTPVVLLVSGDATIAGTINVSGQKSADAGAAGNGNIGDDGLPGEGGRADTVAGVAASRAPIARVDPDSDPALEAPEYRPPVPSTPQREVVVPATVQLGQTESIAARVVSPRTLEPPTAPQRCCRWLAAPAAAVARPVRISPVRVVPAVAAHC